MSYKCNCPELANNPTTCYNPCASGCCVGGTTWEGRMATNNSNNPQYSVLGGVVAPKNSAYAISSMSNPLIERTTTKIDRSLPSLRDRGAIGHMENFNPYNSQYRNNVNYNQVNKPIPKTFGGNFYTNVELVNPTGSPILQSHGINTGGYLEMPHEISTSITPLGEPLPQPKKKCADSSCKVEFKSGGIFGGGVSLFGIGIKKTKGTVPCNFKAGTKSCVCSGSDNPC